MKRDENDRLRAGELAPDPTAGTQVVSEDFPRIHTVRDLICGAAARYRSRERNVHATTGHHQIDRLTGGLRPGDCWLVGADTSWGKSSFAIMVADENLKRGKRVLIVSSEDSKEKYGSRLLARRTGVEAWRIRDRVYSNQDNEAILEAEQRAEASPVYIDARGKTVEWLAPRCKQAIVDHRIDVVIFDYVGAFACKLGQQDRRNSVTYIGRVLTDVAKTATATGISGILLSQLTHGDEEVIPGKYAIRDSKDLTQASEVTLIGYIAPRAVEGKCEVGDRMVKIAKAKDGEAGANVRMSWDSLTASFRAVWPEKGPAENDQRDDYDGIFDNE